MLMEGMNDHWMLSTYLGTMIFNENAILTAFSLSGVDRYWSIALMAGAGTITNDLILYLLGHFWFGRFIKMDDDQGKIARTFFERVFLRNTFLSLVFMKFFFGMRTFLTVYLVAKKKIPFRTYFIYNLCGIFLYVSVLSLCGWLIGAGFGNTREIYTLIVRIVSIVVMITVLTYFVPYVSRRMYVLKRTRQ